MTGVAGVMALVLAEAVAGATVFLWVGPLWTEVKPGFFKLLGAILTVLAVLTWLSVEAAVVGAVPVGRRPPGDDGGRQRRDGAVDRAAVPPAAGGRPRASAG